MLHRGHEHAAAGERAAVPGVGGAHAAEAVAEEQHRQALRQASRRGVARVHAAEAVRRRAHGGRRERRRGSRGKPQQQVAKDGKH
jgi:hypothetical protein